MKFDAGEGLVPLFVNTAEQCEQAVLQHKHTSCDKTSMFTHTATRLTVQPAEKTYFFLEDC